MTFMMLVFRTTSCAQQYHWRSLAGVPASQEPGVGCDGSGFVDGFGSNARFFAPWGIAVDSGGNVYVGEKGNHAVRKVSPDGWVTTVFSGDGGNHFDFLGVAVNSSGKLFGVGYDVIWQLEPIFSVVAGSLWKKENLDGRGFVAQFNNPSGIAVDAGGTVYVADTDNCTIRKVTPDGYVMTIAGYASVRTGNGGLGGYVDGANSVALFKSPSGIAVDKWGNLYITDGNAAIRKVTPDAVVTTLAGGGVSGDADGIGRGAQFNSSQGIAVDGNGNVYVADTGNNKIRKITPDGVVTTLAGSENTGSSDGTGSVAQFNSPTGVAVDGNGNVYVADSGNNRIRKITPDGVVTTLAGPVTASIDGKGSSARFNNPWGIAVDWNGNGYVADTDSNIVRKVTRTGVVTTLAGSAGNAGIANGKGSAARFTSPEGLAVDLGRNVYVADASNCTIRKILPTGMVATLAGLAGIPGAANGKGSMARFNNPGGVALDAARNVYVADTGNHTIRKVTPKGVVTTLAGRAGKEGHANGKGAAASFSYPAAVSVDSSGRVYVADSGNHVIRIVTPDGTVRTLAGRVGHYGFHNGQGGAARFWDPLGIGVDGSGNVYVADSNNNTIRKVTPGGLVSTLDYSGWFTSPSGIAVAPSGVLYVTDSDQVSVGKP